MAQFGSVVACFAAIAFASSAHAQDAGAWTASDNGSEAIAEIYASDEFSGDFGWRFRAIRTSSMGVASDSLVFEMSIILHADTLDPGFYRLNGRDLAQGVVLTTIDGATFRPASATFRMERRDANTAFLDLTFTPLEDDDGVLDPSEPNCRVLNVLRRASAFSLSFPTAEGAMRSYEFSGRGSARALGTLGVCS